MKEASKRIVLVMGFSLCFLLWGVLPAFAADVEWCYGGTEITLGQGQYRSEGFPAGTNGCTLGYTLIKPTAASECSTLQVEYLSGEPGPVTRNQTTTVCGSAGSDAQYKFEANRTYSSPRSVKFICTAGSCHFRFALVR